jgi:hypothetical protein
MPFVLKSAPPHRPARRKLYPSVYGTSRLASLVTRFTSLRSEARTISAKGPTGKCIAHGGGKRCSEAGCKASAVGPTGKCARHLKQGTAVELGPMDQFLV